MSLSKALEDFIRKLYVELDIEVTAKDAVLRAVRAVPIE